MPIGIIPIRETTEVPGTPCPACGTRLDLASSVDHCELPEPGSYSICYKCGEFLRFDEGLALKRATAEDMLELRLAAPEMHRQLEAWQANIRRAIDTFIVDLRRKRKPS